MKRLIVVWLDGGITSIKDLAEISPAYITNGNVTAIIDVASSRYLNFDNKNFDKKNVEEWLDLPAVEEPSVETYAS